QIRRARPHARQARRPVALRAPKPWFGRRPVPSELELGQQAIEPFGLERREILRAPWLGPDLGSGVETAVVLGAVARPLEPRARNLVRLERGQHLAPEPVQLLEEHLLRHGA